MTWYVARGGVAVATDSSEAYEVSVVAVGLGELSEAVSIGAELLVANSEVGVSVAEKLGKLSEAVSIGAELLVANSEVAVSVAGGLGKLSEAVSIGAEFVANFAVAGVGDAATDEGFG